MFYKSSVQFYAFLNARNFLYSTLASKIELVRKLYLLKTLKSPAFKTMTFLEQNFRFCNRQRYHYPKQPIDKRLFKLLLISFQLPKFHFCPSETITLKTYRLNRRIRSFDSIANVNHCDVQVARIVMAQRVDQVAQQLNNKTFDRLVGIRIL